MVNNKWIPLFYDKSYNGYSGFTEDKIKKITMETIDETYTINKNKDAIDIFNNNIKASFKIPEINESLYRVEVYTKEQLKVTVIFIESYILKEVIKKINEYKVNDIEKLKKLYEEYNIEFLKRLCKFHIQYDINSKEAALSLNQDIKVNDETYKKNVNETINTIMTGVKYDPDDAIDDPVDDDDGFDLLTTKLYDYQKCSIGWMVNKERNLDSVKFNTNHEVIIGNIYFDIHKNEFFDVDERDTLKFYGGGLIDEVGLGKTLQSATLSLLNQPRNISYTIEGLNRFNSRATLVVCPNTLCGQWKRELFEKISPKYNLNIVSLLTKRDYDKYTYEDICDADFVIVSFNYLFNYRVVGEWVKSISNKKNYLETENLFSEIKTKEKLDKFASVMLSNPIHNITKGNPNILLIKWHRIIVDEFHEIHSNLKYKAVQHLLPLFQTNYRWVVTGTPFISEMSMMHMVDFLTNYKYRNNTNIMSSFSIIEYLSKKCFRRNTKKSVEQEYKLPPIEEEIILLKFTKTERMMYNAFLVNLNNDKFSKYLRQLCCHPNIADETKNALNTCKTLKDVEKTMVGHYKKQAVDSKIKLIKINSRLETNINNINRYITRQQARTIVELLKKDEYEVYSKEDDNDNNIAYIDTKILIEIENGDTLTSDNEHTVKDNNIPDNIDPDDGLEKEKPITFKKETDFDGVDEEIIDNFEIKKKGNKIKPEKINSFIDKFIKIAKEKWKEIDTISLTNMKVNNKEILKLRENIINELEGKLVSYRFFNNVIIKIKKTVKEDKPKKEFSLEDSSESDGDNEEMCGICMCEVEGEDVGVSKCGHIFCYNCIRTWVEKKYSCPVCRTKLSSLNIYQVSYDKPKSNIDATQLSKYELINEIGTKLANLIEYLKNNDNHTIIFSQWDELLRKVGDVLSRNGIKNVFCKGSVFQRDKAVREFNLDDKIKVIMLSSESAASGTNLTKASQIILLDPVYGSYSHRRDTENQAIGRSHRLGQKNKIKVVRFIIKDTVEEEIYNMNKEEDKKLHHQRKMKEISIDE